jgi:hypothetical protein
MNNITWYLVFSTLHHASCPVTEELILTQESLWKNDFSHCNSVYVLRSAVRTDQPQKCIGIFRSPDYTVTGLSHRNGSINWPQILTNQYQVICLLYCKDTL